MADTAGTEPARLDAAPGHLYVRLDSARPGEMHFMFEQQQKRIAPALLVSFAWHLTMFGLLLLALKFGPTGRAISGLIPDDLSDQIVWLNDPGPGGGGGGGGNQMKEPPRVAELPGKDKITVPVEKPPKLEQPKETKEPDPTEQVNIPAKTLAASDVSNLGTIEAVPGPPTISQGSGINGGAGTGAGSGIGPGTGSGLGPGMGGGTGGGVYRPGNGVTLPTILREVKPQYTSDAMRAKVQGQVLLECVVKPDGSVGEVSVVRSLDKTFGLDEEAIKAAKQWRFRPGTRLGQPVSVLVTIELTFTLR